MYIDHHNPDLILLDAAGDEMQRIDLTRLQTTANIHKLLKMLGMPERCSDNDSSCVSWQASGECERNPDFMHTSCRLSCGLCDKKDKDEAFVCKNNSPDHDCEYWSTMGECTANEAFMKEACARSCGVCSSEPEPLGDDDDDEFWKDEL